MKFEIRSRFDAKKILYSCEADSLRAAVLQAVYARVDLTDANLTYANLARAYLADADLKDADLEGADLTDADIEGADLSDANLEGAYLARANLADANLARANLADADLTDADLSDADLSDANLARANLARANLARADLTNADLEGANLARAYLADADLTDADLEGADLTDADLSDAKNRPMSLAEHVDPVTPYVRKSTPDTRQASAARYRERHPDVPVVAHLDATLLRDIEARAIVLDMGRWHGQSREEAERNPCGTTHCRAGGAVHAAGKAGYDLEEKLGGPLAAGRAIYRASTGRAPHFFATNERALEDIRRCAAEDPLPSDVLTADHLDRGRRG